MAATTVKSTALAQGWYALSTLHDLIQARIERALLAEHELSLREFSLLNVLSRQHKGEGGHLQMKQVADAIVLSQSATTRLVTRLEERGLLARCFCPLDRRGIYTNVTEQGSAVLNAARPVHDNALRKAIDETRRDPLFKPLIEAMSKSSSVSRSPLPLS